MHEILSHRSRLMPSIHTGKRGKSREKSGYLALQAFPFVLQFNGVNHSINDSLFVTRVLRGSLERRAKS